MATNTFAKMKQIDEEPNEEEDDNENFTVESESLASPKEKNMGLQGI